jgi:membrane protease YdiL (CAAX protease family)
VSPLNGFPNNFQIRPTHDARLAAERINFLKLALIFQGSLLLLAMVIGWCLGQPVWTKLRLTFEGLGWGVAATIPMLVFLVVVYRSRARNLIQIRDLLNETLGGPLSACGWLDLSGLALLAGVSEECLFRGVLEPLLSRWGPFYGLIACNVLFGICHAVTPTYAVIAGLMGVYLSLTLRLTSEPNLIIPIACHSLYDLVAFVVVRNSFRRDQEEDPHDQDFLSAESQ